MIAATLIASCDREGGIVYTDDPHTLILAYSEGGGFVGYPGPAGFERLLLYGDGRLLVPGTAGWTELRLSEDGVQRLLRAAVDEAKFFEESGSYTGTGCADCPTTTITARTADEEKTVDVYALGIATPAPPYDEAAYERLVRLREFLQAVSASTFPDDELESADLYRPDGIWLQVFGVEMEPPPGVEPAVRPADFPSLPAAGEGVAVCDPAAQGIRALLDGETGIVDDGGMIYAVAFRDLFPHDPGAVECGL